MRETWSCCWLHAAVNKDGDIDREVLLWYDGSIERTDIKYISENSNTLIKTERYVPKS